MNRKPVVAGQFYPGDKTGLMNFLNSNLVDVEEKKDVILAMLPHAGYIYSGRTAAKTLSYCNIKQNVILLGPNHTGMGDLFSVWHRGRWEFPLGYLEVNEELCDILIENIKELTSDFSAHIREHSLEVIIPFLWRINPEIKIVPICIMENNFARLKYVGEMIGELVKDREVTIIVSSDMSHFISHEMAKVRDKMAIDEILKLDPKGLYDVVVKNNISMCGIFPMTVGLFAANKMGATKAELIEYTTSGEITGDMNHVVGYAGILVY